MKVKIWRECKTKELSFVGITVRSCLKCPSSPKLVPMYRLVPRLTLSFPFQAALFAGLYGGAFSWSNIDGAPWSTKACWYCGLMLIIGSISTATQQSITLYRFTSKDSSCHDIFRILKGRRSDKTERWKPSQSQLYIWQVPVMLLRLGILLFIIGLFFLLWDAAKASTADWKVSLLRDQVGRFEQLMSVVQR